MNCKLYVTYVLIFFSSMIFAQSSPPQAVCYQGVATDAEGRELANQLISLRLSVLFSADIGPEEWIELHQDETDEFGLFSVELGQGIPSGGNSSSFEKIPWGTGEFFLKVEMDPSGGSDFQFIGTNQILSVPYALYSANAAMADSTPVAGYAHVAGIALNDMDTDAT